MTLYITIKIEDSGDIDEPMLHSAASAALKHQGADLNAEMTLVITSNEELHSLNKKYLGIDAPTDVLSFPSDETDIDTGVRYLGDILISMSKARQQAEARKHSVNAELVLLTVHGTLHLVGHDHADPEEKSRMWTAQEEIINSLGVVVTLP